MLVPLATVLFPLRSADRPVLSGPEEVLDAPPFRLHYTRSGRDAPPDTDEDGDGVPDLVTTYRDALLHAADDYAEEGWRPLVTDGGAAGADDIDVYVQDLDIFGYATPVPLPDGTASCHLRLDPGNAIGGSIAAAVATHELHHCVQFRYTVQAATWLYEASATFEQYSHVVDPVLELPVGVLWAQWLDGGETRLAATDGRHEYAAFVFVDHWMQRRGADPDRLPALWEALAEPEPEPEPVV
ncbi:MAG: hypothetical protein KC621_26445, partial [Myxococcales bacterium]|nr:hypothetical protein [Myxococcales bacterium]